MKPQINGFSARQALTRRCRRVPGKKTPLEENLQGKKKQNVVSKFISAAWWWRGGKETEAPLSFTSPVGGGAKANTAPSLSAGRSCWKAWSGQQALKAVTQMGPVGFLHAG